MFAVYSLLQWLLVIPFLSSFFGAGAGMLQMHGSHPWVFTPLLAGGWMLHVITTLVIVRIILSLFVGFALLTRQPWGRVIAIAVAALTLLKPVLGTLLAIYTLWVLLSRDARDYERMATAQRTS